MAGGLRDLAALEITPAASKTFCIVFSTV